MSENKMNAYKKIKQSRRERDNRILREIKRRWEIGLVSSFPLLCDMTENLKINNALRRLVESGKIKWNSRKCGYQPIEKASKNERK